MHATQGHKPPLRVEEVRLSNTTVLHLLQWLCVIAVENRWAERRHFDLLSGTGGGKGEELKVDDIAERTMLRETAKVKD